jgi:hypothetical protein
MFLLLFVGTNWLQLIAQCYLAALNCITLCLEMGFVVSLLRWINSTGQVLQLPFLFESYLFLHLLCSQILDLCASA